VTRKRLSYSLRSLLIFSTLFCVALGAVAWYRSSYYRQARALNDLEAMQLGQPYSCYDRSKTWRRFLVPAEQARDGYTLRIVSEDPRVFERLKDISCQRLYVDADGFGDEELSKLVRCSPNLEKLVLRKSAVTDRGLDSLRDLRSLRQLSLGDLSIQQRVFNSSAAMRWYEFPAKQFTDDALKVVAELPQLEELRVVSDSVGDRQLEPLRNSGQLQTLVVLSRRLNDDCLQNLASHGKLQQLLLGYGQFSAPGLEQLRQLKQLKLLALKSGRVDDACCQSIAQLQSLEMLSLENVGIANEDLKPLAALPRLWNLYLAGPELDNRLLKTLHECPMLAHLHLHETSVDDGGVDDLLSLGRLNEIYVTETQFSKAAQSRIAARVKPKIAIFNDASKGDPPVLFFGLGFSQMDMSADYIPPN
jgi:hypothetical protein